MGWTLEGLASLLPHPQTFLVPSFTPEACLPRWPLVHLAAPVPSAARGAMPLGLMGFSFTPLPAPHETETGVPALRGCMGTPCVLLAKIDR